MDNKIKEKIFPVPWKDKEKIREYRDETNKSFYILNFEGVGYYE